MSQDEGRDDGGRVISASCFRVLSLQLETQNEVDVLKPILEELEVLRLSCVLGALTTVNPKDFEFHMLEAKDFDDEFARFLRSDVFGASDDEDDATGPVVRVVGLFGKQAQVKTQLKRLGGWDGAMEARLRPCDPGMYAVVRPENGSAVKTVVVFAWLPDESFHVDRLRETPAYLLRLLTCLTPDVTCCLSVEDKQLLEAYAQRREGSGDGEEDEEEEYKSYSAAFHVEQQQDATDDVRSSVLQLVDLPYEAKSASKVDVVKGSFPALMAVVEAPPRTKKRTYKKSFQTPSEFCDWLLEQATKFDLRIRSLYGWSPEMMETLLRRCDRWPGERLQEVEAVFARSCAGVEDQCRDEHLPELEEYRARLQVACDDVFQVDALLDEQRFAEPVELIKARINDIKADTSFQLPTESSRILFLPARLPKMMPLFLSLFQHGQEDELNDLLSKAPTTPAKKMLKTQKQQWIVATMRSLIPAVFSDDSTQTPVQPPSAFCDRMRGPLETMKQMWWAEVTATFDAYSQHVIKEPVVTKRKELRAISENDRCTAVNDAFHGLVAAWSCSNTHGLSLEVSSPTSSRFPKGFYCSVEEQQMVLPHNQLKLWSLQGTANTSAYHSRTFLGDVDLEQGEEVVGVFSIQTRSVLVILSSQGSTIVRSVEFPASVGWTWRSSSAATTTHVREISRSATICDYNNKERLLVLGDAMGKVGIYRLNGKFSSMETIRTLDVALKTSLEMPLQSAVLSDGVLYMVDCQGAMQSLNTRNQQTSRKKALVEHRQSRLIRVLDGIVLGWLGVTDGCAAMKFIAAEDLRELPSSECVEFPVPTAGSVAYEAVDDTLYVVDTIGGNVVVVKLDAMLKSESFRIRSVQEASTSHDESETTDAGLANHWLWTFYHLYEKFPVRGEIYRATASRAPATLAVSFVCDAVTSSEDLDLGYLDDGCRGLLTKIMEKLRLLNKPLYGLNLAKSNMKVCCSDATDAIVAFAKYQLVTAFLRELITIVPIQICRAEMNSLTLMVDGMQDRVRDGSQSTQLHSADIAMKLRFGLLSPLLMSWRKQCIVITSMGKQSTGKSYFLNHLTGSSFAISGARCTDGAWLSVRVLPSGVLLVVIDFEGLGSFERTEQEDVFLSVLNASVSMLTIFRMEMRLDKEIDELFAKFQKGSQLIKNDPQLFRGKLYMSVKDVNPNDQRGVVNEFVTKFQRLLEGNKDQNFLTDMYAGQLDINCSPPLGTIGYYRSLSHAQQFITKQLCSDPKAGFASGKAFLDCIRLLLAKVSILDWTSLDESAARFKIAEITKQLPGVLRFGCVVESLPDGPAPPPSARDKLVNASTGEAIVVSVDEVCNANPSMATKWQQLAAAVPLDQVDDEKIDLGSCVNSLAAANKMEVASKAIQTLFTVFQDLVTEEDSEPATIKSLQHTFDSFLSFVVLRRCLRVQKWTRCVFEDRVPDAWSATEQQALGSVQTLLVRCLDSCSKCQLGCMKASAHAASGDAAHDCGTNHACGSVCGFCVDSGAPGKTPHCAKPAGHEGRCECGSGDHTCGKPCVLEGASNCGKACSKKAGHDDEEDHRCSVGLHKCGDVCTARGCSRLCVLDIEAPHTAHKCEADRCMARCFMEGCSRSCSSTDHFHGQTEAKVAFDVENPDLAAKNGETFDASSDKPTIHMCDEVHACPEVCAQDGICHIEVMLKQSSKTFVGARGTFQYTFQEMNGSRKKCSYKLEAGQTTHAGKHSCCVSTDVSEDDEDEEMKGDDSGTGVHVRHYCDVRCPCCSYFCQKEHGHSGLHKTTHGNMRNTVFFSDDQDIDLVDRKYVAGERGTAEMCNLFCSKMGRGHVHYLDCEKEERSQPCVYTGSQEDKRRHCTRKLEPKPDREQDEVLHDRFWDTLGWEDPCTSLQEREQFAKCPYKCDAPDHDGKQASHCVLPAWHAPAVKPSTGFDGFSYVGNHKFECSHVTAGNKMHHVFVLDASGSMQGQPWEKLNGAFREYVHNRINDGATLDLVSVVTFDSNASIVWEAQNITLMTQAKAPYSGGGTSFASGLRAANEVLSRVAFDTYKPVLVFFSDGQPSDAQQGEQLASHIANSYAKYGLDAFAVGFGSINLTVLQRVAERLGGSYCHVLTGDELKATFHSISASLGTRAGLALTKPLHEMICVICQKELASEATAVLQPCQHELHVRCLRRLVENTAQGEAKQCPTCRRNIQA